MLTKSNIVYFKIRHCAPSSVLSKPNFRYPTHQKYLRNGAVFVPMRFIGSTVDKDPPKKKDHVELPERKVSFFTCENIYDKWRKGRSVLRIPQSGVYAEMCYVDSLDALEKKGLTPTKTVMCIHGIPGNYGVFSHLIKDLTKAGIRVIVPTFPASLHLPGKYRNEFFRHSVEEKTQVFKDFLKVLNVTKIDAIIAHSSAIYPSLRLVLDPELEIKCQVLFNTGGHKKTVAMKPYWITWTCSFLYLNSFGKLLVQKTGKFIMKHIMRTPIKDDNFDGIMLLAITMVFSEYWKTKEQFQEVAKRKIPTLYCFSEDDKVVERKLTYEVISLLGASVENITFYDKMAQISKTGKDLPWLRLISFEEGSHYVFRKYPVIINNEVIQLLQNIKDSS